MSTKNEWSPAKNTNPILRVARDSTIIYSNEVGEPLLHEWGMKVGEKLPSDIGDIIQRVLSHNNPEKIEVKVGKRVLLVVFHPLPEQKCVNISGFDISDQKELEEKLQESERKLSEAQRMAHVGNWDWNISANKMYRSDEMQRIFGLSPQIDINYGTLLKYMHPEDRVNLDNAIIDTLNGNHFDNDYRIILADGEERIIHIKGEVIFDEENIPIRVKGIVQDITERKRSEEKIRNLANIVESSSDAIWTMSLEGIITTWNRGAEQIYGYSAKEVLGKSGSILTPSHLREEPKKLIEMVKQGEEIREYETSRLRKDGKIIEVSFNISPVFNTSGKLTAISVIARDTTERKREEEKLQESERRLSEAQRIAHIGNWDNDLVIGELYWSDEMYRIFGRKPQEGITYDKFLSYIHPGDRDYVYKFTKKAFNEKIYATNYRIVRPDGEERIVHSEREVIFNERKNPVRMRGTVQDVTERKKAEEKIKILAKAVESSNDAIMTGSLDGIVTSWNKGAEQIYGYSAGEILGQNASILEPEYLKGDIKRFNEKIKRGEKVKNYETVRLRKDGTQINVSVTLSPVFDDSGKMIALSVVVRDITERIKAEKLLAKAEEARKKEIHHRIKNNLQVISSLLDLQAEKLKGRKNISDSEMLNAFKESQDRVTSMALIHEELYRGGEIDKLDFSSYIKKLADNLFLTYRVGDIDISLNMDLEENAFFDIDTAIPLGIIINELVSNSFKYAFQGRDKGKIRIKLCRDGNGECEKKGRNTNFTLTVSDDGIGIPDNLDIDNLDSLGLQLVTSLVDQLDGELELKRNNGTEFTIRFTVTEKNNPASFI